MWLLSSRNMYFVKKRKKQKNKKKTGIPIKIKTPVSLTKFWNVLNVTLYYLLFWLSKNNEAQKITNLVFMIW